MRPLAFCIPGDLSLPTGGYRYDRELLARLPSFGVAARHAPLGPGFPHPTDRDIRRALAAMAAEPPETPLLIDGLALGALPPQGVAALPQGRIALVHHPLGFETGLDPARRAFLLANERAVLAVCDHAIVTSAATARLLSSDFGVPADRITVAEPGVEPAPRAPAAGAPPHVLAVGAVSPRKAFDDLVAALARLSHLQWRLTIAGSLALAPAAVAALEEAIARSGVADRIALAGDVDEPTLAALYASADLFANASLYEGYGMALTEALAHGLPIVTTRCGAAADAIPDAAALKVPPGDADALAAALGRALGDPLARRRMADAARAAAALLPTWDDAARTVAETVLSISERILA